MIRHKLIRRVSTCYRCPCFNNEYCNLGAGHVVNEWRNKTMPSNCPIIKQDVYVKLSETNE